MQGPAIIAPGATIGILGGGQLARMLAIAAARLGFRVHIFCPEAGSPAFDVAAEHTLAAYDDIDALERFAHAVSVVTLEFENVPVTCLEFLAKHSPVAPSAKALATTQDRLIEKTCINASGLETAPFAEINNPADLTQALAIIGLPAILKTRRFGYDGKGQLRIKSLTEVENAWAEIGKQPAIIEGLVPFKREVSVICARKADGSFSAFDVTENEHRHHILARSVAPARITQATHDAAIDAARRIGEGLDYVGLFAVEFFVVGESASERLIVNEIAPRVHNSGHWTIDGAITCQFEQHIRAVTGWPLGDPSRRGPVEMLNLVGDEIHSWPVYAAEPCTKIHLYGKKEARPGRKMGHVTRLLPKQE